jgi:hypothetical protein
MRIKHNGQSHELKSYWDWIEKREAAGPAQTERLDAIAREGVITEDDGTPVPGPTRALAEGRALGSTQRARAG